MSRVHSVFQEIHALGDHGDQDLVASALRLFADVPGETVEDLLGGNITQSDVWRWRAGRWKRLMSAKREFLTDLVAVWRGNGEGRTALMRVSAEMGLQKSERVKTLIRWISHPEILPKDMPWDERFRIGDAVARIDGFTTPERRQLDTWRQEMIKAHAELEARLSSDS